MKGTFFKQPLEWSIETEGESWQQGSTIKGVLKVTNHGAESASLDQAGVALAHAEIKKVHARATGVFKPAAHQTFSEISIDKGQTLELAFSLKLAENSAVTDKKTTFYLTYGQQLTEGHLQLKIIPLILYDKIIGLLDTFCRFKLKEYKSAKNGIEYKLIPPTSRDMANIESLNLALSMKEELLQLNFGFQVKKLDRSSITTKITKESVKILRELPPKDYSLGQDMINQDRLLNILEGVIGEVKIKDAF
jgi:hypothetical protein